MRSVIGQAMRHVRGANHDSTEHVHLNRRKCTACWECVSACNRGVIGKIDLLFHKHARIDRADRCSGCALCIAACQTGAIQPSSDLAWARLARLTRGA